MYLRTPGRGSPWDFQAMEPRPEAQIAHSGRPYHGLHFFSVGFNASYGTSIRGNVRRDSRHFEPQAAKNDMAAGRVR